MCRASHAEAQPALLLGTQVPSLAKIGPSFGHAGRRVEQGDGRSRARTGRLKHILVSGNWEGCGADACHLRDALSELDVVQEAICIRVRQLPQPLQLLGAEAQLEAVHQREEFTLLCPSVFGDQVKGLPDSPTLSLQRESYAAVDVSSPLFQRRSLLALLECQSQVLQGNELPPSPVRPVEDVVRLQGRQAQRHARERGRELCF
mmetsp:Transcript_35967/g.86145  ORF Transcript_35967/g.86145 Transcript_35967/m.86145 type:complete len:204 (+) Transcript_35967:217-828(+)